MRSGNIGALEHRLSARHGKAALIGYELRVDTARTDTLQVDTLRLDTLSGDSKAINPLPCQA